MSSKTGIQWCDSTWNPIRGCSRVSEGCENCYAEAFAVRFSGPGQPYEGLARRRSNGLPQWTGKVAVVEKHMLDPIRWRKPRRIFVNSMSDLFHENVAEETIDRVFAVMASAPRHTFQVLTKRPERMREYMSTAGRAGCVAAETGVGSAGVGGIPFLRPDDLAARWPLPNVWLGTSVENQSAWNQRVPELAETPAAVRFLSCEPLLGSLDLCLDVYGKRITWVIVGGESGKGARPLKLGWARLILDQCRVAGVACFIKQLGAAPVSFVDHISHRGNTALMQDGFYRFLNDSHGADMDEWPMDIRIREFPQATA